MLTYLVGGSMVCPQQKSSLSALSLPENSDLMSSRKQFTAVVSCCVLALSLVNTTLVLVLPIQPNGNLNWTKATHKKCVVIVFHISQIYGTLGS